ncbi:hypothetical protein ACS0TY_007007 [Phlomoides rotata]
MIKLWVAEGFLKSNGTQTLEEIAEDCLNDLIDRKLIIVCEHRPDGKIKSFRIHESSLNKLSLGGCSLHWEDLSTIIGSLPQLEALELKKPSCEVRKWSCVEGDFLCLKFLQIESCALESWTLDSASYFPILENLVLVGLEGDPIEYWTNTNTPTYSFGIL